MLLNDIGNAPDATFRKINQHLETNYGFKIAEDVSDKDLISIMEQIEEEVSDLKLRGDDSKSSSEISKRLLVLEGLRSLKEYSMMTFQSPKLKTVVSNLVDYVVDTFEISGMSQSDFDRAMNSAMDEYRSSRYRFPDAMIEQRVRQEALSKISKDQSTPLDVSEDEIQNIGAEADQDAMMSGSDGLAEDNYGEVGKRSSALGGHAGSAPDTVQGRHAMKVLDNPALSLVDEPSDKQVPMIRDKSGRLVADPFAAQQHARRTSGIVNPKQGRVMKEHKNLVKNLRRLLETEVSQAEVMMAAKGFAQELQEMIEKIGRLQNEDLPPVTDQMRETYGMESASAFQTQIYGALQSVMDALYTAKGQVDDAVSNMAATGQFNAPTDMDKSADMGGMEEPPMDAGADLDNIEADLGGEEDFGDEEDLGDEFGGAETEEPLGRSKKMESARLQQKVLEMQKLVAKARKLREARG